MSELKLIDTYEVELCSDEPIEIEKFKIKTVSIDRSELQIGQYVFLKDQVVTDQQFDEKKVESKQEAKKELEELEDLN